MGTASRSFSLVDQKVAEAEFFLQRLAGCGPDFFAVRCYVGAFVSSSRSVTFSLQAVLSGTDGFREWYAKHQETLRANPTLRFFSDFRTVNIHIGENLASTGSFSCDSAVRYWFVPSPEVREVPGEDVLEACAHYFRAVLSIVFDCYMNFGPLIDAKQRFTEEYFSRLGKSIEDAEKELGLPRGYTDTGDPHSLPHRWQSLRDLQPGCEINDLFDKYLGKVTTEPERLRPYAPRGNTI